MKHKDKTVLMVRDGRLGTLKFGYFTPDKQDRREFQGWRKATAAEARDNGYALHPEADEKATTTSKTTEKGA